MSGKKGMIVRKNREDSPKFAEYYKKEHPEWSIEECENKAKWFKKSCNYQCIEYYEKNYPNLSHEEHLNLKKQIINQKKSNNKLNLEYYKKNYPNLSCDEQEKLWHKYTRKNNYQCKEYYLKNNISEEAAENLKNEKIKIAAKKISDKISGELNGMHHSKTSQEKRNSISPRNIAFYERKYPELSHEEHLKLQQEFFNKNALAVKKAIKPTNIEYYLNQGMSEEDAIKALKNRQTTFSLEKCIKKYGEEKGLEVFNNRQKKWISKLKNTFSKNGYNHLFQSKLARDIIETINNKLNINVITEKPLSYKENTYSYDLEYNMHIIEINGDYWHCNPKFYDKDFFNKNKQLTAQEIWKIDKNKKQCAIKHGYKYLVIWENDYNTNPEKIINKCINFLTS